MVDTFRPLRQRLPYGLESDVCDGRTISIRGRLEARRRIGRGIVPAIRSESADWAQVDWAVPSGRPRVAGRSVAGDVDPSQPGAARGGGHGGDKPRRPPALGTGEVARIFAAGSSGGGMASCEHDRGDFAATWAGDATEETSPGDAEHNAVGACDGG